MAGDNKTGRFLGVPYDWRKPTRESASRGACGILNKGGCSSRRSTGGVTASTFTRWLVGSVWWGSHGPERRQLRRTPLVGKWVNNVQSREYREIVSWSMEVPDVLAELLNQDLDTTEGRSA